jgi:hypothetical protein
VSVLRTRAAPDRAEPALDEYYAAPIRRIRAAAQSVAARSRWDVLLIVRRGEGIDAAEFDAPLPPPIRSIRLVRTPAELAAVDRRFDLCLVCSRVVDEERLLKQVRERKLAPLIVLWTWDNHHSRKRNLQIAALADFVIPGHRYCARYLMSPHTILGGHVPLGSYQWSRAAAAALFERHRERPRDNALHGGFVAWSIATERAEFLRALLANLDGHALRLLEGVDRHRYFTRTAEDRWLDWAAHKAGLILPFSKDLSTRFFDSLLTGQVPIMAGWCRDFDAVIDEAAVRALPVVRLAEPSVPAVEAAWREALAAWDAGGSAGAARRHRFALERHHLAHRLSPIAAEIAALAAPGARFAIETGMGAVGPVLQRD